MKVGVVVLTLNPDISAIRQLREAVKSSPIFDVTLLIVDSGSEAWKDISPVADRFLSISRRDFGHGSTRNMAARELQDCEIVVFMTQDALPVDGRLVDELCGPIARGEVEATYARQIPAPDAGDLERFARSFNYPEEPVKKDASSVKHLGVKAYFFSNVCSAVRYSIFCSVGGFPEHVILNEDMALAARLIRSGHAIQYVPTAVVIHSHNYSLQQQFKRNFDIGASFVDIDELRGVGARKEGARYFVRLVGHLVANRKLVLLPYAVIETFAKLMAHQLGKRHRMLPLWLKGKLSMHSCHWFRNR